MKLAGQLAKELVAPLATLLIRSVGGDVAGTVGTGLLKIAERLADDYYQQQELVRNFQRIGEKIVQKLEPRFQQAVDAGGVDVGKVAQGLADVLLRDGSAQALLDYDMQPDRLADAWRAAHPDRWNDFTREERQLHSAALDDAARYLVEVAAELPRFQSRFSARIVQELGSVSEDLDRILTRFDDVERYVRGKGLDDQNSRYEADYRCAVLRKFDYMELLGADIPREARRHPLSVAYVSLSLLAAPEGQGRDGEEDAGGVSQGYEEILDQMGSANRRLLIRGEAGSGKSTLLRWTALQAAQPATSTVAESGSFNRDPAGSACRGGDSRAHADALPAGSRLNAETTAADAARTWRDCIPFLIRLRDYPQGKLPAVFDLPRDVAKNVGAPPEAWVKSLLENGRALLLFDGVDEVPNDRRDDVRAEITSIIQAYPQNFFLVSTRPAAVPAGWLAERDFAEALINPMSDSDRTAFIRKWHAAVQEQLHRDKRLSDEEDLPGLAERLTGKLRHSPPIARLATNPLLCGMICALHRERQEQLPETQVELCEDLCKTLLHRREKESRLDTEQLSPTYSRLNYEQKRAVVQELAHYMVRNGQSSVAADQADGCIAEALSRFAPQTSPMGQPAGLDAADVRRALVERSGLLREPTPGRLDFIHNTLKEYLAGDRFAHLWDAGLLVDHALDSAWQPAIMFAAGSRVVGFADELIDSLLASADSPLARTRSAVAGWFGGSDTARARKLFAVRFCNRLSEMDGVEAYYRIDGERVSVVGRSGYRLPTEAEWEYACRAGTTTKWCCGDEEKELDRFAWYEANSGNSTHPVGQKEANAWGLHDVHGNVWEWCEDAWHGSYQGAPTDGSAWSGGGAHRVYRGGSWADGARRCRCAYRFHWEPGIRFENMGFRLVLAVSVKEGIRPFS